MDFLTFLKDYENEDVSAVKDIFESNKAKENAIIKEAFNSDYPSKKEALFNLDNYFVKEDVAPKTIDVSYVTSNLEDLRSKIDQLSEGDIRIIIHNHEDSKGGGEKMGFEEESATPKKKRGRPRKGPGIVYDEPETQTNEPELEVVANEPSAESDVLVMDDNENPMDDEEIANSEEIVDVDSVDDESNGETVVADVVGDENILSHLLDDIVDDGVEEERDFGVTGEPSKLRWSDIVSKIEGQNGDREELVGKLSEMALNDEELKLATEMAETGEIVEDGGRISEAAGIISKINKM